MYPALQAIAVQSGLAFNYVEFGTIKSGVVDLLPYAEKFDGVAIREAI